MSKVIVTNRNVAGFTARFDGQEHVFPTGEAVAIEVRAAAFLFGFGLPEANRDRIMVRNGWLRTSDPTDPHGPEAALRYLRGFVFTKAPEEPVLKPRAIMLPTPKPPAPPTAAAPAARAPVKPQAPSGGATESEDVGEAASGATATRPGAEPAASPPPAERPESLLSRVPQMLRGAIGLPPGASRAAIGPPAR